jgi:hypothetical protein
MVNSGVDLNWLEFEAVDPSNPPEASQEPFGDEPADLRGRIQAEHFDEGGEDVAYNEFDPQWSRPNADEPRGDTRVDLQSTSDVSGEYNVGKFQGGEWLEYTVDAEPGTYDIRLRVATPRDHRRLRISLDGRTFRTVTLPNTGDWNEYETVTVRDVHVDADGTEVLRIEMVNSGVDLNWLEFEATDESSTGHEDSAESSQ